MSTRQAHRGFTLLETMIVVAVLVAAAGIAAAWWNSEAKRQVRADRIGTQAMEMAQLARAVDQYLRTSPAAIPADGTAVEVTPDTLIGSGYLPNYFAVQQCCGMWHTPLGQRYRVYAAKQAGVYRAVVMTTGKPSTVWMHRYGIAQTEEGITGYQLAVMHKLRAERFMAAGIVKTGNRDVDVMLSGFQQSLAGFVPDAAAAPSVVALVGFPEHSPTPPIVVTATGGGGGGTNGPPMYTGCYLAQNATCASGYTEQWSYRLCDSWGVDYDHLPSNEYVNTAIGQVAIRRLVQRRCNSPIAGNRNSIPYREQGSGCGGIGLEWPAEYAPPSSWYVISSTGATTATYSETCDSQTYYNVTWTEHRLGCSDGRTATDYYWSTCGRWMNNRPGTTCTAAYYYPQTHAIYSGGLTDSVRAWPAVARGSVKAPASYYLSTVSSRSTDAIVRTLPVCTGSVGTSPVNVRRRVADGGEYEYMELYDGSFVETIQVGADTFTATCETHGVIQGGQSMTVLGQTVTSACPSVNYPYPTTSHSYNRGGSMRGLEAYRVRVADNQKPVVRVCCKSS